MGNYKMLADTAAMCLFEPLLMSFVHIAPSGTAKNARGG